MLLRFLILFALLAAIGLAVLYNRPTARWVQNWQLQQQIDTLLKQRNWQGLHELCERQQTQYPDHPGVLKGLAAYYTYSKGDPVKASHYYKALLTQTPQDEGARLAYANLLRQKLNQPMQALTVLYEGSRLNAQSTVFPHQMGNVYLQAAQDATPAGQLASPASQRLYKLAGGYYQAVLARNPKHYGALFQSGRVASQLGQWDKAAQYFCQCVDIAPKSYRALYNLGYSLMPLGQHAIARQVLITAVHSPDVDNALAYQLMQQVQELTVHYGQPNSPPAKRSGVFGAIGASQWHNTHKPTDTLDLPENALSELPESLQACLKTHVPITLQSKTKAKSD